MAVTYIIVVLKQCFEVKRIVIKYYSQCLLIYLLYRTALCSGTENANKRAITKLRFHYRVVKTIFSQIHLDNLRAVIMALFFVRLFFHNSSK